MVILSPLAQTNLTSLLQKYENGGWVTIPNFYGGKLSTLQDASSRLDVTFSSDKGKNADLLRVGQKIRLYFGLSGLLNQPLFYGYVANPGWNSKPGGMSVSFECFDFLAQAGREQLQTIDGFTNYDGWDPSMAIRDIVESLNGAPVNAGGCIGTYPQITIQTTDNLYFPNYINKLAVMQQINNLCYVDAYPSMPYGYRLWQDGNGRVHHRKVMALDTLYPRMTIQYASSLHELDVRARSAKLATAAVVVGGTDPNAAVEDSKFQASYSETSQIAAKGFWQQKSSAPNLMSNDECLSAAKRIVTMYRQLYITKTAVLHEGLYLHPGDVVTLDDSTTGRRDNYRVTQLELSFSPGAYQQKIYLGNFTYLPMGLIALN